MMLMMSKGKLVSTTGEVSKQKDHVQVMMLARSRDLESTGFGESLGGRIVAGAQSVEVMQMVVRSKQGLVATNL